MCGCLGFRGPPLLINDSWALPIRALCFGVQAILIGLEAVANDLTSAWRPCVAIVSLNLGRARARGTVSTAGPPMPVAGACPSADGCTPLCPDACPDFCLPPLIQFGLSLRQFVHRNNNLFVGLHLVTGRPLFAFSPGFTRNPRPGKSWPLRVVVCRHVTVTRLVCNVEGGWQMPGEVFFYDYSTEEYHVVRIRQPGLQFLHHDLRVNHKTRTIMLSHQGGYNVKYPDNECDIVDLGFLAEVTFEGVASAPHSAAGPAVGGGMWIAFAVAGLDGCEWRQACIAELGFAVHVSAAPEHTHPPPTNGTDAVFTKMLKVATDITYVPGPLEHSRVVWHWFQRHKLARHKKCPVL